MHPSLLISIGIAGAALAVSAGILLVRGRPSAQEKELRRLLQLNREGRICEGMIDDVSGQVVTYSYTVSGVGYVAAQDLSAHGECGEETLQHVPGNVSIKYERVNPSNSMVHCQEWSGLRLHRRSGQRETTTSGG